MIGKVNFGVNDGVEFLALGSDGAFELFGQISEVGLVAGCVGGALFESFENGLVCGQP